MISVICVLARKPYFKIYFLAITFVIGRMTEVLYTPDIYRGHCLDLPVPVHRLFHATSTVTNLSLDID